ncbi:uncharacterized protein LOC106866169 isoform X3 [Brachypodium distachyon]|uniref:uncharacterized protein LOC106866169 isoform X3 n=1 Tax=Brachypodium distachyon TaxID=15368 RepID=UPI000D0DD80D|nr:uncharacterized protein LOC106866169 isoform X3 [Brachypodium distachyon]|eukprot:XP_024315570.1 uncharacterized protein LOC106866169 isoform X3 [Brachypodium distachyon]
MYEHACRCASLANDGLYERLVKSGLILGLPRLTGLPSDMDVATTGESNFIEVVGCPEVKDCRPSVIVSNFREITNFNDVTQHYLYCIYTHLDLRRPPSPSSAKLIEDVYEIVRDYTDEGDPGLTFRFIANSVNATEPVLRAAINKLIEQRRILRVIGDDRYILAHR